MDKEYARAAIMARRYNVSRQTWWRWDRANQIPPWRLMTPTGDKLWKISECDARFEKNRKK